MGVLDYLSAAVLTVFIITSIFLSEASACSCHPDEMGFNETTHDYLIKAELNSTCRKCLLFSYNFTVEQDWAFYLCVNSNASRHAPLLISVREQLSVMSFQVPQVFEDKAKSSFSSVCHTLCPIANYFDERLKASKQYIFVEIASEETEAVYFEVKMSILDHFVLEEEQSLTVNITPSEPRVMQYNVGKDFRAFRIEATSPDESCMLLAIQNIQCPFSDSEKTVERSGYYQTLMKQSGIAITKNSPMESLYIILMMKTSNDDCVENFSYESSAVRPLSKEVTVRIVPAITDEQFTEAVLGAFGFFILIYFITFAICIFIRTRQNPEVLRIDVEATSAQNYGTPSGSDREHSSASEAADYNVNSVYERGISIDEVDMDTLPDAEVDKNVVRTKTLLHVSDLSHKDARILSKRSKVYSWNLVTIAIFYALPVVQLVYINQRIVNLTGNQDLCYYNFLCSQQVWVFSDFNHVYSNIGYLMLGILFLLLVWRRESVSKLSERGRDTLDRREVTGIPYHFGLFYAMGFALIIEGILSGCYHVCPNKANFQFDTAFMYVISVICMLKLYQARHPDITAESHTTWMVLSVVIFIGVGGVLKGGLVYWILFVLAHVIATYLVSVKIYYMGCVKFNTGIFKRANQKLKQDMASKSYFPQYKGRFILLTLAVLVNLGLDIYVLIQQPTDFASIILVVFILNLMMYLFYYVCMKIRHKESIGWIPIFYMILSFVFWGVAAYFFFAHNTSWKVTPAESREKNKHCLILNFYDHHDIWHFISSCALFFFFMVLFTLDDDLDGKPRHEIVVF